MFKLNPTYAHWLLHWQYSFFCNQWTRPLLAIRKNAGLRHLPIGLRPRSSALLLFSWWYHPVHSNYFLPCLFFCLIFHLLWPWCCDLPFILCYINILFFSTCHLFYISWLRTTAFGCATRTLLFLFVALTLDIKIFTSFALHFSHSISSSVSIHRPLLSLLIELPWHGSQKFTSNITNDFSHSCQHIMHFHLRSVTLLWALKC